MGVGLGLEHLHASFDLLTPEKRQKMSNIGCSQFIYKLGKKQLLITLVWHCCTQSTHNAPALGRGVIYERGRH